MTTVVVVKPIRVLLPVAAVLRGLAVLLVCLMGICSPAVASEWHFGGIDRVVAVSDIHGAYDAMLATFRSAGIVDEELSWSAGATHLVITGDLLDRGPDSRPVMDLIMRLEREASDAGGRVHQLIGNHEVMNLVGDLRYVASEEYAAFIDDEPAQERALWFQRYRDAAPEKDEAALRSEFARLAPPGFFGHRRAFRADGHYGKWLLQKPLMIVINGTAFVHGGLSPYVAEQGLEGINGNLKSELARYVSQLAEFEGEALLSPTDNFYDHPEVLKQALESTGLDESTRASIAEFIGLNGSKIHSAESPLWYRGTVGCSELIEGDGLQAALQRIGASRVVIGHTPTLTRRVLQRMSGRVIEIDTGMLHSSYKGSGNALIIEGDTLTVVNETGATNSPPVQHPRRVGKRAESVDAGKLADILAQGSVVEKTQDDSGRTRLKVSLQGSAVVASFDEQPRKKGFLPEMAAYKLDRLLGLDMVPVTVRREIDGVAGTLQFVPGSSQTEQQRAAAGRGSSGWCGLSKQWNAMYIFDSLIFNPGRGLEFMRYSTDNWQLLLVNHSDTFGNSKNRPPYLNNIELNVGEQWLRVLRRLDDDVLREQLGDVLPKRQLAALGKRRDNLIGDATE